LIELIELIEVIEMIEVIEVIELIELTRLIKLIELIELTRLIVFTGLVRSAGLKQLFGFFGLDRLNSCQLNQPFNCLYLINQSTNQLINCLF